MDDRHLRLAADAKAAFLRTDEHRHVAVRMLVLVHQLVDMGNVGVGEPALHLVEPVRLLCREGHLTPLLAELAVHRLDLVSADRPMPNNLNVRGYSLFLGESDLTVFAAPDLARSLTGSFPALLDRAPFLLPWDDVTFRPGLMRWFESQRIYPRIVGEFEDSALLKAFGRAGAGLFVSPTAIVAVVQARQHGLVGRPPRAEA